MMAVLAPGALLAAEPQSGSLGTNFSANVSYYAMRDEPSFAVFVTALQRGPLRLEARYNDEARSATSVFAGYSWTGGENVAWSLTPIIGGLFGSAHGVVPGVEASVSWRRLDLYVEAEYVHDLKDSEAN